ncbi:MAG: phosphoribulokinase, partial [Methanoregulaceae archaeon]|nr:phosphoribulokinase [Methanoregulaceae archaeon]
AGDSGSGKTTFTAMLRHLFGDLLVSTISLDDYHLLDREERKKRRLTPLAPEANNLKGLLADLRSMKAGRSIEKMVYNHSIGILEGPVKFTPSRILILEGLHTLYTAEIRENLDFSLYVDPASDVKREWKIKRDTGRRGYSEQEVIEEIRRREADYSRYIAPQREVAEAIVNIAFSRFGRDAGWIKNTYRTSLFLNPVPEMSGSTGFIIGLSPLLAMMSCPFSLEYSHQVVGNRSMAVLTADGEFDSQFISSFAVSMEEETGVNPSKVFKERSCLTPSDIIQLILCWRIINDILSRA